MVALLTRLQLRLNLRSFRGNTGKIVGLVILSIYAAGIIFGILALMVMLRTGQVAAIGTLTTLLMGFVTFIWPVSVLLFGANDPLSASRFALLPVRAKQLRPGLLVATALSFGGILVGLVAVGYLIAWSASGWLFALAALCAMVGLAFTITLTRTITAAVSATLASRKFRDWALMAVGLVALAFAFSGQVFGALVDGGISLGLDSFTQPATIVSWTPFGWAWALPWDVARADWLALGLRSALLVVSFALLWQAWGHFLDRALTSPLEAGGTATKIKGHGRVDRLFPPTPAGAIAARTLRYWSRDPRRKIQAISVLIMPVIFTFAFARGSLDGDRTGLLVVPPLALALIGVTLVSAEICYDGSALWTQIVAGTRGRDDRLGRVMALGLIFGTFGIVLSVGFVIWSGRYDLGVLSVTGMVAVLGISAGVGSWMGAIWNYPVPPAEQGMMASRGNMSALGGVLLAMLLQFALVVPLLVLALAAGAFPALLWVAPVVNIAVGIVVGWGGIVLGGRYLDGHWPEVLKNITWSK